MGEAHWELRRNRSFPPRSGNNSGQFYPAAIGVCVCVCVCVYPCTLTCNSEKRRYPTANWGITLFTKPHQFVHKKNSKVSVWIFFQRIAKVSESDTCFCIFNCYHVGNYKDCVTFFVTPHTELNLTSLIVAGSSFGHHDVKNSETEQKQ